MMTKTGFIIRIVLLFIIFLLPWVGAWYVYKGTLTMPGTVNHGYLLQPPIQLKQLSQSTLLPHKWLMLYVMPTHCSEECHKQLYYLRQVQKALGKDSNRVARIGISSVVQQLANADKDLQLIIIPEEKLAKFLQQIPGAWPLTAKGVLLIADPNENILLFYAPNVEPKGWLKDLKRLLSVSQIG